MRPRLAAVLALVAAAGLLAAGVAGAQEAPGQLWEEFPLVPTEPSRPLGEPELPAAGVAGAQAGGLTRGVPAADARTALTADDPLGALPLGLLLTGVVSAMLLLGAAALPRASARDASLRGLVADRRLELTLAGAMLLLVTTLVYAATAP